MIHAIPQKVTTSIVKDIGMKDLASLDKLEPKAVWKNFEEISKIYRQSQHNRKISAYLKTRLENSGFAVKRTPDGTICALRNVDEKGRNAVILQAHMDMVAVSSDKNPRKPIAFRTKDGWLYANDRTLGADDGIGVSAILAIADDAKFKKYPLEVILTTNEELGMDGARALVKEDFKGKYLINLDSEKIGVITKGCAGIEQFDVSKKINVLELKNPKDFNKISVKMIGAKGGHSAEITEKSLNPVKVFIEELQKFDNNIVSITGGEASNAVPRSADAVFLVKKENSEIVLAQLNKDLEQIKINYGKDNPNFEYFVSSKTADKNVKYIEPKFQKQMLKSLEEVKTGLLNKFENGDTKTSQNLGVLKLAKGNFMVSIMGRSSNGAEKEALKKENEKILSKLFGEKTKATSDSPIWEPQNNSYLEDVAVKAYKDTTKMKPISKVEHGGLETAIFYVKAPNLDSISIGPTLENPHSTEERLEISTVKPFYDWLSGIIQNLKK